MCAVVLAAGAGTRLRPLTRLRPKALCPVGGIPLVDLAVERAAAVAADVAVNVHHGRQLMEAHLDGRVHLSIEEPEALGTAGALGLLRDWIGGRATIAINADAWCPGALDPLVDGWDGERIRLLLVGDERLRPRSRLVGALMPWTAVGSLKAEPSGLYEQSWRAAAEAGSLEVLRYDGPFVDCGTPAQYLAANLAASGGRTVIGEGARVDGVAERCVLWPNTVVEAGEHLVDAIRADEHITVLVR